MNRTYGEALSRIAERTLDNYKQLRKDTTQRRVSFVDLYGVEYLRQGDADHPATFYISISPDFMYYERFALKLQIMPFASTVKGVNIQGATIGEAELALDGDNAIGIIDGTSTAEVSSGGAITPNPHTHSLTGGSGGANYGLHFITTTSTNWRIKIHDVDVTAYFKAQQDGDWITGEGIYPTNRNEDIADFYDVLAAACDMYSIGESADANKLLVPEMKKVEIISDAPFQVATMVYVKFSSMNR